MKLAKSTTSKPAFAKQASILNTYYMITANIKMWLQRLLFVALCFAATDTYAQRLTPIEWKQFKVREDSLKSFAKEILMGREAAQRFRADSNFTRILVRTLLLKNSFRYPFDSLVSISKLYPSDSTFRIFTWQVVKDDNYCRQRGFIQMKTPDGSLKLFPLIDYSEFISDDDSITTHTHWMGAIYYRMVETSHQGKKYYTLMGYDENNIRTTRKWLDVLYFDEDGKPVFGKQGIFSFANDSVPKPSRNRFLLEYKKDGRARMQYDEEMEMIIYDHLISETNQPEKKYTLVPDGDYEGFKWINGVWVHIDKVFDFQLNDGEAPVPQPFDFNQKKNINNLFAEPAPAPAKKPAPKAPVKKPGG